MADDKELGRLYRKHLMIVSTVIFIYSIAGGKFANKIELFGAGLTFNNPKLLEICAVLICIFMTWRHVLLCKGEIPGFFSRPLWRIAAPKMAVDFVNETIQKVIDAKECEAIEAGYLKEKGALSVCIKDLRVTGIHFSSFTIDAVNQIGFSETEKHTICFTVYKHPVSFCIINFRYRMLMLRDALFETEFGDTLLPLLFSVAALCAYIINFMLH